MKSKDITVKSFIETFDFDKMHYNTFRVCRDNATLIEVSWSSPLHITKTDAYMAVLNHDADMLGNRVLSATYDYIDKELKIEI